MKHGLLGITVVLQLITLACVGILVAPLLTCYPAAVQTHWGWIAGVAMLSGSAWYLLSLTVRKRQPWHELAFGITLLQGSLVLVMFDMMRGCPLGGIPPVYPR